jgi:polyferredoxin
MPYQTVADAVLLLHFGIVAFVVGGLLLVVVGNLAGWPWVNRLWLRLAHLVAIGTVVAESWLGFTCPLTTLESRLRRLAGTPSYSESFVEHWVQRVLFYEAPSWVFVAGYTVFGLLVLVSWWYYPPNRIPIAGEI